jgi:hypothetical protein
MPEPGVRNGWQAFEQVYLELIEDTDLHYGEQETSVEANKWGQGATVVLVNSDLVDILGVEHLPFPHPSFSDRGHFGRDAGLLSRPCLPSD